METPKVVIIKSSYTEAQKRAIATYRAKNKERMTEYSRKKAKEWYEANRDAHNKKCLERYYAKKKAKDGELAKEL